MRTPAGALNFLPSYVSKGIMSTDLKAPPQSWPVLAEDPDWSLRQGPTVNRTLSDGAALSIEFTWSTGEGFSASVEVDGVPYTFGPICDLPAANIAAEVSRYLAEVSRYLVSHWPSTN